MTQPAASRHSAPIDWDHPATWGPTKDFFLLTLVALFSGAALVAVALLIFSPQRPERLLGPALIALVALGGAWLLRSGRIVSARWFLAGGIWVTFTLIAAFTGGVRAPVALGYPLFIVMVGWQISSRAAVMGTVATVLAALCLAFAEVKQWLPQAPLYLPAMHAAVLTVVCVLGSAMIVLLVKAYRGKLRQLHRSREDLRRHSMEVESSRATLQRAQAVAKVGSWTLDFTANQMEISEETRRIFGISGGTEGSWFGYLARVHETDRPPLQAAWDAALRTGDFDHEHRIVVGQEMRWVRQKAEFVIRTDGTPVRALGVVQDITERKRADERIAELAYHDQLSGLPNRSLLFDRLRQAMVASERDASYSALLFLDLDNFKELNDTRGHDMGDALLRQVANRLLGCVRAGDTVARLGGDEFVVMLAGLGSVEAAAVLAAETVGEKVLITLNQPYSIGGQDYRSTPSIGVTLFGGGRLEPIEEPLKRADLAMYQSKAAGRNTLRFFDPAMQAAVTNRVALESDLREALARGEFMLHFQPVVNSTGQIMGAEALVRWQHPERGLVPPDHFIGVAEETGLILPLGQWVLEQACAQLQRWAGQPVFAQLTVAVNVSAREFCHPDFQEQVLDVIRRSGANPQRLKLELTESLLVTHVEDVIARMSVLKTYGIGFSLDDFGTGYSSLSYLSRLPLDLLKIDRSFVKGIETDPHSVAICAATISLAHSLGMKVVAEGVETAQQCDLLRQGQGCDYLQGYLFGRPVPLAQFEPLISQSAPQ